MIWTLVPNIARQKKGKMCYIKLLLPLVVQMRVIALKKSVIHIMELYSHHKFYQSFLNQHQL